MQYQCVTKTENIKKIPFMKEGAVKVSYKWNWKFENRQNKFENAYLIDMTAKRQVTQYIKKLPQIPGAPHRAIDPCIKTSTGYRIRIVQTRYRPVSVF